MIIQPNSASGPVQNMCEYMYRSIAEVVGVVEFVEIMISEKAGMIA